MDAKFVKLAWYENDGYHSPVYEYEYRGYKYTVVDHRNGYSETMASQHKYEQIKIDDMITKKLHKNENEKSCTIDEIFDILGWD